MTYERPAARTPATSLGFTQSEPTRRAAPAGRGTVAGRPPGLVAGAMFVRFVFVRCGGPAGRWPDGESEFQREGREVPWTGA
jgi:hypothetical protein